MRTDKHRLLTIAMGRLLANLMERAKLAVGPEAETVRQMLVFFCFAFDEFCLQPVINHERGSRYCALAPPQMDFIYLFQSIAMNPEMAFVRSYKSSTRCRQTRPRFGTQTVR